LSFLERPVYNNRLRSNKLPGSIKLLRREISPLAPVSGRQDLSLHTQLFKPYDLVTQISSILLTCRFLPS
jgi:hypothetical protein